MRNYGMQQKQYYYLVAGLPELSLYQPQMPFPVAEWVEELEHRLHGTERAALDLLLLPADHENLLTLLAEGEVPHWAPLSRYEPEYFLGSLREGSGLPPYFHSAYEAFREEGSAFRRLPWAHRLTEGYYDYALAAGKGFVYDWLHFDRDLRNLLAGWNMRRHHLSDAYQLVGENEVTRAIRQSQARDFGQGLRYPQWGRWVQDAEIDDLAERHQNTSRLRWSFIDQALTFSYFTADVLLGYLLKLQLIEERLQADAEQGRARLEKFIHQLAETHIPE